MKKPKTLKRLKVEAWELCKQITRKRYEKNKGQWHCYTCGRLIDEPAKAQTGHFLPSSTCGALLRHDLRNLRVQCYNCNINQGGNGAEYYRRMVQEVGQEAVDQLFQDKQKTIKADAIYYSNLIETYKKLL